MKMPAARVGDMHICPMASPTPHVGGPITTPGSPTVLIGGLPAATVGSICTCVGPPDAIVQGSPTVLIGGKPAARMGDMTAHGGKIAIGSPTVLIGTDSGAGSAGLAPVFETDKPPEKPVKKLDAGQSSGQRGKKGTWNDALENPEPDTIYEVTSTHDGKPVTYRYETDDQGRTIRVTGKLQKSAITDQKERDKIHRNPSTQAEYGGEAPNYDGGHLIGTLFQGPAEKINIVPQLKQKNRYGEWRSMERKWAEHLDDDKEVEVEILLEYSNDRRVPIAIFGGYKVNNGKEMPFKFKN